MSEWVKSLQRVWLFGTLWTITCQAPPSMGFSGQEYWSGLPFPSPGGFPNPGMGPRSPRPYDASLQTKLMEVMKCQISYFKSLKMNLWNCCTQYAGKFGKLSNCHRTENVSFCSNPKDRSKNVRITIQLHSSHTLAKKCSKFSMLGFTNIWPGKFQMFNLRLEKAEELEITFPTSVGS